MIHKQYSFRRLLLLILLAAIAIQISIALLPDTMGDLISYRDWSRALVREGFVTAYFDSQELQKRGTQIIYPPVIPILYWSAGHAVTFFNQSLFFAENYFLDTFLKFISILFNIAILWIIYLEYRKDAKDKIILAALCGYALNPGIIFNTSYWGQTDSISAFFIVAALYLLSVRRQPEFAAALSCVAVMTKPTIWPIALLIAIAVFRRYDFRRFISSSLVAAVLFLMILSPFILAGRVTDAFQAFFLQIDASPYVSANAHNLWWILQGGLPMLHVDSPFIAAMSYKLCGIILVTIFIGITLMKFWHSKSEEALYFSAASLSFGFYILSTHMHENHLFSFFPIFALFAFRRLQFKKLFYLASIVFFANILLHDPYLNHVIRDFIPGPQLNFSFSSPQDSPIMRTFEDEGKSYVLAERSGRISLIGFFLTFLNAQIAVVLFVYWLFSFYRTKNFDFSSDEELQEPIRIRNFATVLLLVVVSAVAQVMTKAMRFF